MYCGLTGKKAEFHGTCTQINLNQKFYEEVADNQDDHKRISREKGKAFLRALWYLGLSAIIFYATYRFYIWKVEPYFLYYFDSSRDNATRYGSKAVASGFGVILVCIIFGLAQLAKSIATIILFFNAKKLHLKEKAVLDVLTRLYHINRK